MLRPLGSTTEVLERYVDYHRSRTSDDGNRVECALSDDVRLRACAAEKFGAIASVRRRVGNRIDKRRWWQIRTGEALSVIAL